MSNQEDYYLTNARQTQLLEKAAFFFTNSNRCDEDVYTIRSYCRRSL